MKRRADRDTFETLGSVLRRVAARLTTEQNLGAGKDPRPAGDAGNAGQGGDRGHAQAPRFNEEVPAAPGEAEARRAMPWADRERVGTQHRVVDYAIGGVPHLAPSRHRPIIHSVTAGTAQSARNTRTARW